MMKSIQRLASWLKSMFATSIICASEDGQSAEIDSSWHGGHWQNLLSSPMDARHYVMEDWASPLDDGLVPANPEPARAEAL
jgi:hypothetical protein